SAWIRSRSSRSSATKSRLFAGRLSEGYGPGDPSWRASGPRSLTRSGTRLNNVAMPRLAAVALAVLLLAPSPAAAAGPTPTPSTPDLLSLASQLRSQGIRRVTGHVVGDESFFDAKRMGPGWKSYFFLNESPALSALTVDRGRYKGHATRQPALAAALSFRAALLRAGISVAGRALTGTADASAVPLATIESVPLT